MVDEVNETEPKPDASAPILQMPQAPPLAQPETMPPTAEEMAEALRADDLPPDDEGAAKRHWRVEYENATRALHTIRRLAVGVQAMRDDGRLGELGRAAGANRRLRNVAMRELARLGEPVDASKPVPDVTRAGQMQA